MSRALKSTKAARVCNSQIGYSLVSQSELWKLSNCGDIKLSQTVECLD